MVQLAEKSFEYRARATIPGGYLVDVIPMLRHVPEWIPGAKFQRFARECGTFVAQVRRETYQATLKAMVTPIS